MSSVLRNRIAAGILILVGMLSFAASPAFCAQGATDPIPLVSTGPGQVPMGVALFAETSIADVVADASGPERVHVGFFFLSGGKLDFVNSSIALDFYFWMSFPGSTTPKFEFLNSKLCTITKLEEDIPYAGTNVNYVVFRVNGVFDQIFDLRNYPFDKFNVQVFFEDTEKEAKDRLFVADEAESGFDPMFQIIGWNVEDFKVDSIIHPYKTTFGTPLSKEQQSYSQIRVNVHIARDSKIIFLKIVTPAILFLLIAVMSVLLPIDQISQKISLCVASLFSSVAYHLSLSQGLPQISYLTFVDKMMLGNYLTIVLNLIFTIFMFLAFKNSNAKMEYYFTRLSWFVVPTIAFLLIIRLFAAGFLS